MTKAAYKGSHIHCMAGMQAPAPAKAAKAKERKKIETNVEKEVDRIIDSQDNEYVLSRPKCVFDISART